MAIKSTPYGTLPSGDAATLYTLTNANGMRMRVTNYGGIIVSLTAPDREGKQEDIVLGKRSLADYLAGHPYFGAITGRVAGRIKGAEFELEGQTYKLVANNGTNCLHGGLDGFDKCLWEASVVKDGEADVLRLHHLDPDGNNGFPGNLDCTVDYRLSDDNELIIDYRFTTDKPTPVAVTNHSYFNLKGEGKGDILGHEFTILADKYAVADDEMSLTGEIASVEGQQNDFRKTGGLGWRIEGIHQQHGDNYFFPEGRTTEPRLVARVREPETGRIMECLTTEPGLQFYTSSMMEPGEEGKTANYKRHSAFCLETQGCPHAVHDPAFGEIILLPGKTFTSRTIYKFSAE